MGEPDGVRVCESGHVCISSADCRGKLYVCIPLHGGKYVRKVYRLDVCTSG